MIDKDRIVVRYKAGCGGETMCLALYMLLNDKPAPVAVEPDGRTSFTDVFGSLMQFDYFTEERQVEAGLSRNRWEDMEIDEITAYIEARFAACKDRFKIGKAHPNFRPDQAKTIFASAFVLDLLPYEHDMFIPRALLYRKLSFKRIEMPPIFVNPHPQYEEAVAHYESHGWFPQYWQQCLAYGWDLYDLRSYVRKSLGDKMHLGRPQNTVGADHIIPAGRWVVDPGLEDFRALARLFGHDPISPQVEAVLTDWTAKNRANLDYLGLLPSVGQPLSIDQQVDLLHGAAQRLLKEL